MNKVNQRGVGALGLVLVVVILGLIGFIGWFVYHSTMQTTDTLDSANNSSSTPVGTPKAASTEYVAPAETAFSKLPAALQAAIVTETTATSPSCVKDGKLVDIDGKATDSNAWYTTSGFAEASIGCDGSAATIFAKSGNKWSKVDSTQMVYSCDKLKAAKVPVEFLKAVSPEGTATCVSGDSETAYTL